MIISAKIEEHEAPNSQTHTVINARHSFDFSTMSEYLVCLHTCQTCICDATGTILWSRKHSNVQRHAVIRAKHPLCTEQCPANQYILKAKVKDMRDPRAVRPPTTQEYEDNVTIKLDDSENLIDPGTSTMFRRLNILYVADPVQGELNKVRATADHSFVKTLIRYREWLEIKALRSYVHGPVNEPNGEHDVRVIIHEWVSQ